MRATTRYLNDLLAKEIGHGRGLGSLESLASAKVVHVSAIDRIELVLSPTSIDKAEALLLACKPPRTHTHTHTHHVVME